MTGFNSALVAGATGFIGSALARRLAEEGAQVFCLVRNDSSHRERLEGLNGIELIEIDPFQVSELSNALSSINAEVVFNFAAYGVDQNQRDPELLLQGNVDIVTKLLLVMKNRRLKRFIHIGSCFEYGMTNFGQLISEDHRVQPTSLYGAAKAASVIFGNAVAKHLDIPFVTLRLFGVFGIGEAYHRLIPYLIHRLHKNESVDLTPGEQVRDLLYIDDAVEAFLAAARCEDCENYSVFNVCSGQAIRIRDIAEAVADTMNKSRNLLHFGRRAYRQDEVMWIVGSNQKFSEATRWYPKVGLAEGIKRMVYAMTA